MKPQRCVEEEAAGVCGGQFRFVVERCCGG